MFLLLTLINGVVDSDNANTVVTETFTNSDSVDGGDGTDTLIVTTLEAGNLAGVTNVETLAFNGTTTLDADLSFDTIDLTEGSRYIPGCYIDYDSTEGKLRHLKRKFDI